MTSLLNGQSETTKLASAFADIVEAVGKRLGGSRKRWCVVGEANGIGVWLVTRGKAERIGDLASLAGKKLERLKAGSVELRLAAEKLVSATLKLPAEAHEFAGPFVEHSLEKLTPWRVDKVLYGYEVVAAAGADGQHEVRVLATSRDIAETLLGPLHALGIQPDGLGSAGEPLDRPLRINLLAGGDSWSRRLRRKIKLTAGTALVLSLALFGASQWLASATAERQISVETQLAAVRERIAANAGTGGERNTDLARIQAKTPQSAVFLLIDRVAKLLPDSTVLDELEIKPETVRLAGTSADASGLVGLLEADPFLRDAQFGAPVIRQLDGRDRFDIVLARHAAAGPDNP